MKKLLSILAIAVLVLAFACSAPEPYIQKPGEVHELTILHTNDHHGHPLKFYEYPVPDIGGLPARSTFVKEVRAEVENVLLCDAGDFNTGMPESNFFNAEPDILGYNHIGYDVAVLGNHEFDKSLDVLKQQMELANFPMISANVRYKNGDWLTKRYIIKEYNGFKVAIFGITKEETSYLANPENVGDLEFLDEVKVSKEMVKKLTPMADVVICLAHVGIYDDIDRGSERIAANVPGIHLIIDGHTHTKTEKPIMVENKGGKTMIVSAEDWGKYVGRIDLKIQDHQIVEHKFELVPINMKRREKKADGSSEYIPVGKQYKEDQELLDMLTPFADKVEEMLSVEIGEAKDTFYNADSRKYETAIGNLVSDAMFWYTESIGADFAIQNGGGIREDLPKGIITKKIIYQVLPFDNSVVTLKLKGSDVIKLFEFIGTINRGAGAFAQVSSQVRYTVDFTTKTCKDITINGKAIDPDREYTIVTNSYMASGGDGYDILAKAGYDLYDTSAFQRDAVIEYIESMDKPIIPETDGRITVIE